MTGSVFLDFCLVLGVCFLALSFLAAMSLTADRLDREAAMRRHPAGGRFGVVDGLEQDLR